MTSLIIKDRVTEEIQIVCEAHQEEPGASLDGLCGCGVEYISRETTEKERTIQEIEHLQRVIVSAKERLQELGIHNWEKIGEED